MLLVDKYAPKSTEEMVGNEKAISTTKVAVLNWIHRNIKKAILVYGPPGVGKTLLAYCVANDYGLTVLEVNASDVRDKKSLEHILSTAVSSNTLFGKKRIILIDDVDALPSVDRGAVSEIVRLIKKSMFPVILTANDAWDKKISQIRMVCTLVRFRRLSSASIKKRLEDICKMEGISIDPKILEQISKNANGDMRAAINDLQARTTYSRDITIDIFSRVRTVFKSLSYAEARSSLKGDVDPDLLKLWIDENIPNEYIKAKDIHNAYYYMSTASLYEGRIISRNYWGFLRYVLDFITAGVSLSKESVYRRFVKYSFPSYLSNMSKTMSIRSTKRSIAKKLAGITHSSTKDAGMFFILIHSIIDKDRKKTHDEVKSIYGLTDKEIEYVSSLPPELLYI